MDRLLEGEHIFGFLHTQTPHTTGATAVRIIIRGFHFVILRIAVKENSALLFRLSCPNIWAEVYLFREWRVDSVRRHDLEGVITRFSRHIAAWNDQIISVKSMSFARVQLPVSLLFLQNKICRARILFQIFWKRNYAITAFLSVSESAEWCGITAPGFCIHTRRTGTDDNCTEF